MISELLKTFWLDILIVLVFILVMIVLLRKNRADLVKKIIFALVVQAEQVLGSKTGEEKYAHVISEIYAKLPLILRLVFTRDDFDHYIEECVDKLKIKLTDGNIDLLTYAEEVRSK